MRGFKLITLIICCVLLFYALDNRQGQLPPLGNFLNPWSGFWQNNSAADEIAEELHLPDLIETVYVKWDDRHVPHIFAQNPHDLYFAQGYIMAKDRLWQLDFITRYAAGRLSEIFGKNETVIQLDKFQRRIGMGFAAENSLQEQQKYPQSLLVVEAYGKGVNAYIENLAPENYPVEFKILDYAPEKWQPIKTALVLKYMAWDLTGHSSDRKMSRVRKVFDQKTLNLLYPDFTPFFEPVIPKGTKWDFLPLKITNPAADFLGTAGAMLPPYEVSPFNGSNNWAVSGSKTKSGKVILCNDMHLNLNLPSIWYEIQLNAPGINVYGVTLPGTPAVIVGFNENISWGFTNAASDVLDWYQIEFKDKNKNAYQYDGGWHKTIKRIEKIKIRGAATIIDTVVYTHHGPVPYVGKKKTPNSTIPTGAAMRWTAHDPSVEMEMFLRINKAKNYEDYLDALQYFDCPAQNTVFADQSGTIALRHNGKFPVRWPQQGKFMLDGSNPQHDWQAFIPRDQIPQVKNPTRGFVSSANQHPVDEKYPYYLGTFYAGADRSVRINELLKEMKNITPQDMVAMQNDVLNISARRLLPTLLHYLNIDGTKNPLHRHAQKVLENWDYLQKKDSIAPLVFEKWRWELFHNIWKDEMESTNGCLQWPAYEVTENLILQSPDSPFFDNKNTTAKETLAGLVNSAFSAVCKRLQEERGPFGENWQWAKNGRTEIGHIGNIPGFGRSSLITNGALSTVNAIGKTHGPSWRMVVELGEKVKAWGIYPGGQSGNPGSKFYDDFIDDWVGGHAYELLFLHDEQEKNKQITGYSTLRGN